MQPLDQSELSRIADSTFNHSTLQLELLQFKVHLFIILQHRLHKWNASCKESYSIHFIFLQPDISQLGSGIALHPSWVGLPIRFEFSTVSHGSWMHLTHINTERTNLAALFCGIWSLLEVESEMTGQSSRCDRTREWTTSIMTEDGTWT